jgi:hypothetical protein
LIVMNRRAFLALAAVSPFARLLPAFAAADTPGDRPRRPGRELSADLAVIGGGVGGVACALAAARNGHRVLLTEEYDWIGGQLTSQAVPPDEYATIETFPCTRSYGTFRTKVRDYYRRHYPLTDAARAVAALNPGNGTVSKLCHEPRVAVAVLLELLAPYLSSGRVHLLQPCVPVRADTDRDRVKSVTVRNKVTGDEHTLVAPYFADATELGDLLPLTGTEFVTGAESRRDTDEPHAPEQAQPDNHQAITVCFAMDHVDGADQTIDRPREYAFWRDYVPQIKPAWPGKLLAWQYSNPGNLKPRDMGLNPTGPTPAGAYNLWAYRRLIDKTNFAPGAYAGDVCLVNWPQNDYLLGNLYNNTPADAAAHLERARQLSLSLFYWMQTEAPRPDGGQGWKGLRLRPEITGTNDGLAMAPYVRESRRLKAAFTVTENHVGTQARARATGKKPGQFTAEKFPDSIGIGSYRIDLHPSTGGDNYVDVSALPFQIPLGALIPRRVENLLAACKNIGTTHITNGCYRLHPVEWSIGEAAGELAALCLARKTPPRQVRDTPNHLADLQSTLTRAGVALEWPEDVARKPR